MVNNLNLGIFLEDVNTLLPWGASKDELRNISNPVLQESKDRIRLYWNEHKIFSGIKSQVEVAFYKNRTDLLDHPNANDNLNFVSLNFYNTNNLDSREQYKRLKTDFVRALGTPTFDSTEEAPFSDLPFTEWDLADVLVVLMVFERFGEYCIGEVWRKPLPARRKAKPYSKSA